MTTDKEMTIKGEYTFTKASDETIEKIAEELNVDIKHIAQALRGYKGKYINDLKITKDTNLIPSLLRDSLAALISGTTVTPTFKANYVALGSDSTLPDNADIALGTETLRSAFDDRTSVDNVAYLDKFFNSAEVGGNTYLEAGVFVDGTATTDSGYLLSHINMNETMTAVESLTINATFTIS